MGHISRQAYTYKQILALNEGADTVSVVFAQDADASADIAAGTVLGEVTASGKYSEYDDENEDGTEVAVGVLKTQIAKADVIAGDVEVAMYYTGSFRTDQLVGLDAAALVDLKGRTVEGKTYF